MGRKNVSPYVAMQDLPQTQKMWFTARSDTHHAQRRLFAHFRASISSEVKYSALQRLKENMRGRFSHKSTRRSREGITPTPFSAVCFII